jgi:hypothetical protein
MDDKTKRAIRKLIEVIPEHLHEYKFAIWNTGGHSTQRYGMVADAFGTIPGVDVACWGDRGCRVRHIRSVDINEHKLGLAMANYVALTNPANVAALLEENDRMRGALLYALDVSRICIVQGGSTPEDAKVFEWIKEAAEKALGYE